ncbi:hypothetical protein Tco_0700429 [Tanacetum coccineum]
MAPLRVVADKIFRMFLFCCALRDGNSSIDAPNPNSFNDPPNVFTHLPQPQTYSCELCGNDSHYGYDCPLRLPLKKEKELRQQEQAANVSTYTVEPSRCFNSIYDDDDEERNEELSTIPKKESDKVIKSSVEDLVPILSESEDTFDSDSECDLPFCDNLVTFSNPLFDSNDDFTSSDDESLPEEDVPKENFKIYLNPLFEFDDEYISSDVNPLSNEVLDDIENKDSYVSNFDEPLCIVTSIFPIPNRYDSTQ